MSVAQGRTRLLAPKRSRLHLPWQPERREPPGPPLEPMRKPPTICQTCRQATTRKHDHAGWPSRAEKDRRRELVLAWVDRYGWTCPGYQTPAHTSFDLTADHIVPRAQGGETGPLRVLCRSCNGKRGARHP